MDMSEFSLPINLNGRFKLWVLQTPNLQSTEQGSQPCPPSTHHDEVPGVVD